MTADAIDVPTASAAAPAAPRERALWPRALRFLLGALVLYAVLYGASEWLADRNGHSNPMHRIALAHPTDDWVVLGASHAMPLDFDGARASLEARSGRSLLVLAAQGTGPLYQRFVLEEYLRSHRARNLLYVVDSFAFYSRAWNEDRFEDAKLVRGTPFAFATAMHFARYVTGYGVSPRAWLDYASGFSKINNRDRFERDAWEGEGSFERTYRPSASATAKRIAYLYPDGTDPERLAHYLGELEAIADTARGAGMEVAFLRMPTPPAYRAALHGEDAFDAALDRSAAARHIAVRDFSGALPEPALYFDTDHLNRSGIERFSETLAPILSAGPAIAR